jgi:hypothetical protein
MAGWAKAAMPKTAADRTLASTSVTSGHSPARVSPAGQYRPERDHAQGPNAGETDPMNTLPRSGGTYGTDRSGRLALTRQVLPL